MKYLGLDYGSKHVGVAVSDMAGVYAFPKCTLSNDTKLVQNILEIIQKEGIERIVVGDTRSTEGYQNDVTAEADRFVGALKKQSGIPTERMWEAWSSLEAARFAPKGKKHDDASAAAIILQRYIEMRGNSVQ